MDVVVTPISGSQKAWSLTDRLGRKVGSITQSDEAKFGSIRSLSLELFMRLRV